MGWGVQHCLRDTAVLVVFGGERMVAEFLLKVFHLPPIEHGWDAHVTIEDCPAFIRAWGERSVFSLGSQFWGADSLFSAVVGRTYPNLQFSPMIPVKKCRTVDDA
ncbi:MAG: hypothetical protein JWO87_143 [Phycisphaerales bacterium]|nr:hypothetical protein [Phycisphaerales bacterium]